MDTLVLNADTSRARRDSRTAGLKDAGFRVIGAESAAETLRAAAEHQPAVVLLALPLPDLDGQQFRNATATSIIVHLSDDPTPEAQLRWLGEAGAHLCLPQSVEPGMLAAQIRSLLRIRDRGAPGERGPIQDIHILNRATELQRGSRVGTFDWDLATGAVTFTAPPLSGARGRTATYAGWSQLLHPADRERAASEFLAAASSGREVDVRFRMGGGGGPARWMHALGAVLGESGAESGRLAGVVLDVTDEMEADERLRTLAEAIPHMVWVARMGYGLEYANGRLLAFAGLRADQARNLDYRAHLHPEDYTGAFERLRKAMQSGQEYETECRLRSAAGGPYRWHLVRAVPVPSPSGDAQRWIGTCTDIEEDMRIREALGRIERRFRLLWESNVVGMLTADRERVHEANDAFLHMTGYMPGDPPGGNLRWDRLPAPEYRESTARALAQALERGWCDAFELEFLRKDGARIPVLIGLTLLEREPVRFLGLMLDLTRNKELEKRLIERQKIESVGVLAGGVAHGFNNLLTGIMGNATLARDAMTEGSREHILLDEVIRCSEAAADLTRQMLAYSGKGSFFAQSLDLGKLVRERATLLDAITPRHIVLRLDLDPEPARLVADAGQMQQILLNLTLNALEAIGDQIGTVRIHTGALTLDEECLRTEFAGHDLTPGAYVCLEVADTGRGMDAATRERIFDPFFSTKFQGRGLGLAAVAGIVRAHRGAILVETERGRGSRFRIFLPAAV